jgi:gamma-glutamyl hydrolase
MKIKIIIYLIFTCLLISKILSSPKIPIIAIYANPEPDNSEFYTADYINSNIVRWLESSGAGVVVIHPWQDYSKIDEILSKVNGVLFQGGSRDLDLGNRWEKTAKHIFDKVIEMNERGHYFPLLGICQGFELIHSLFTNTVNVLSDFDAYNMASPLFHTLDFENSRMFAGFTEEEKWVMQEENVAAQFHHKGIKLDTYNSRRELDEFFDVTTTARDRNDHSYINSVEAKTFPIYAIQHHPEKISFERRFESIPTHIGAILLSQRISQFFVEEARKNKNYIEAQDLISYDYIDTMTDVKRIYYFQDAVPVLGEKLEENKFLA